MIVLGSSQNTQLTTPRELPSLKYNLKTSTLQTNRKTKVKLSDKSFLFLNNLLVSKPKAGRNLTPTVN